MVPGRWRARRVASNRYGARASASSTHKATSASFHLGSLTPTLGSNLPVATTVWPCAGAPQPESDASTVNTTSNDSARLDCFRARPRAERLRSARRVVPFRARQCLGRERWPGFRCWFSAGARKERPSGHARRARSSRPVPPRPRCWRPMRSRRCGNTSRERRPTCTRRRGRPRWCDHDSWPGKRTRMAGSDSARHGLDRGLYCRE